MLNHTTNFLSPTDKQLDTYKFSQFQKNNNSKIIGSPNTTNSDLLTAASLTSQQSNESLLSNNNSKTNLFIPLNVNVPMVNSFDMREFNKGHRYNYSMTNYPQMNQMNYFYPQNTNTILNIMLISVN